MISCIFENIYTLSQPNYISYRFEPFIEKTQYLESKMFPPESKEHTWLNYWPQILLFINQQSIVLGAVMMLGAMRQVLRPASSAAATWPTLPSKVQI